MSRCMNLSSLILQHSSRLQNRSPHGKFLVDVAVTKRSYPVFMTLINRKAPG